MKARLVGLVAASCILGLISSFAGVDQSQSQANKNGLSDVERGLLNEINQARAHPEVYASYLEKLRPLFKGKVYTAAGGAALTTQEGWSAVEEAIKFMQAAKPAAPLTSSQGLYLAALALCKDQGGTSLTGHKGTDSSLVEQRVKPFGTWQGGIGENLSYGNDSPRERLLTWLIDDGFASRGHRMRIMSPNYRVAGVSCGPHAEYQTMCVLTLAGGFVEAKTAKATPTPTPTPTPQTKPGNKAKSTGAKSTNGRPD